MTHTITFTEQELLVIVNALQNAAAENRSNFEKGETYEQGNHALIEDAEERISIRTWREFFDLQELKGFDKDIAAQLVFSDKADELLDAVQLSTSDEE